MRRRKGSPGDAQDDVHGTTASPEAEAAFLMRDGRILLTPGRRSSDVLSPTAYEAMGTPPADATRKSPHRGRPPPPPPRFASSHRSLPLTGSAHRSFHDAHSHRASERSAATQAKAKNERSALSRNTHKGLWLTAQMLFALSLLVAVGARASIVSLFYLLVFCFGVVRTFESRAVTIATLLVALLMTIARSVYIVLYATDRSTAERWTRTSAASLFGVYELETVRDYLATIGVDALVLVAAAFHYFVVLRKLRARKLQQTLQMQQSQQQYGVFNVFDTSATDTTALYRRGVQLKWLERLSGALLFATAMSRPAFATGVYFALLLLRLVNWTFLCKKVTVAQLVFHDSTSTSKALFIGPAIAKLLVALSVAVTVAWYVFQLDDVKQYPRVVDAATYIGFADFRAAHVEWSCYLFAACQFLLLLSTAQLCNVHAAVARDRSRAVFDLVDNDNDAVPSPRATVEMIGTTSATTLLQPADARAERDASFDVQYLLSKQPFLVRAFLHEGGLLLASAAAIVWCVSYPSYASLPFIAWAFLSLALYGLKSPPVVIWVLIVYGTVLSITEYVSNLTIDVVGGADYVIYGLKAFDYPFLDLSVHNVCLVFIYYSIRTRWQYQDVLREYRRQRDVAQLTLRATEVSVLADGNDDDERSTMADLRLQADILNQMKLGYGKIIELWVHDAKQVVFTHLDALVLLTIVAVAISTKVSFLQIGYLVLAVLLMFFFEHRRRFWRVLLYYALAACLAVFVRNIDCVPDAALSRIGLECYSSTSETWSSLWPTLFSAQLLIIVQLVFQLVIYVTNKETIDERLRTMDQARQRPLYFVSRLGVEIDNVFRAVGVLVCYIALLVVAVQYERGTSRLNTNVVGTLQLVLLVTLLGTHLASFTRAPRTSLRMKVLWSLALLLEIAVLIARYVYQFQDVTTYLDDHVFTSAFMSARDFGLENHAARSGLSGVFFYVMPTVVVMVLCFWHLASLMRDVYAYDWFAAGRSRAADRLRFALHALQQVVTLFSTTAVVLVAMYAALDDISLVGAMYVLVLVGGRPLVGAWSSLWFPLFWVSALALVLKYAIQLDAFSPDGADAGADTLFAAGDSSDWVGLVRLPEREPAATATTGPLWHLLSRQLLVMLLCCVQRVAQYFEATVSRAQRQQSDNVDALVARFEANYARQLEEGGGVAHHRTSSVEADDDDDDNVDRTTHDVAETDADVTGTFMHERTASPTAVAAASTAGPQAARDKRAKLRRPSPELPVEKDFVTCFRDFCIGYASRASVNVVMLLLTISCFVRQDVISVVYMLLVRAMMYAAASTVCARWWVLATLLSLVIVAQYAAMLWLPPALGVAMQDTPPWSVVPLSHQQWFVLSRQHKWGLFADFVALLSVYMLPNTTRVSDSERRSDDTSEISSSVDVTSARRRLGASSFHGSVLSFRSAGGDANTTNKASSQLDPNEYEMLTRKHLWYFLEFVVLCFWLPLLLVLLFGVGAQQGGIASVPYLLAAVGMLYRLDDARSPSSPWIQYLRKWNWLHLFVIVLLHAPYVRTEFTDCRLGGDDDDASSTSSTSCFSIANVLGVSSSGTPYGLIAIFVAISIQVELLTAPAYRDVRRLLRRERARAPVRREEIVRDFYRRRTAQWFALKKDKSAGIQRLKIIVSKLVHKVEELMDIAMGLHYNLPPMAPARPSVVECSQNSVTLAWAPPVGGLHKVRYYRIARQVYPSMTLLGDFGDIVELRGDCTQATIEGLRPGTTYQFKVCAVSRMGEGPFSVPSDPVATHSLNFDGNTTAGWMKYRREQVPRARFAWLVDWMHPTFLHRYVVLDRRHLVYYRDEEVALKHRSRKRRRKLKTTFLWRDVTSLQLSNEKVQFDDLSPSLYCFEVTVRAEGAKHDAKYIFQPDLAKDFNKFLSALAFAVPLDAVDDSIIACLVEKRLPHPRDPVYQTTRDDAEATAMDENASEWSSVTGDESALGDKEDEEFDQSSPHGLLAWRIPLHRMLYKRQNAAFQLETVQYDVDDQYEPSIGELMQIVSNVVRSHTAGICCFAMIVCFAAQADLFNMVYVFAAFGFLILESPRPNALAWVYLLQYTFVVIALRYAFQLSIFCLNLSDSGYYYPSVQPYCVAAVNSALIEIKAIQPTVLLGVYKFDGVALAGATSVLGGLQWNLYVLLCMVWHRRELIAQGLWVEAKEDSHSKSFESDAMRALRASQASSHDSIDDDMFYDELAEATAGGDEYHRGIVRAPATRYGEAPPTTTPMMTAANPAATGVAGPPHSALRATRSFRASRSFRAAPSMSSTDNANDLAAELLEEIKAQDEEDERKRAEAALAAAAARGDTGSHSDDDDVASDGVGTPLSSPPPSGTASYSLDGTSLERHKTVSFLPLGPSDAVVSEQVEIDDDSVDLDFAKRPQLSWTQRTFPRACSYFASVVCAPPPQWDKDIHIAITGEKPGRDFYTASLSLVLFSSVYAVIFFSAIGEPDASSAAASTADTRLTSSSMLSAYLVLVVVLEVTFIIWDRVAYVCQSLKAKLVLQYVYTLLLHVSVWWLIPSHTSIYFQHRPALVFFYLVHCAYLWLGALQLRYGYPAFKGSKYNYTRTSMYTRLNEKTFGLVMAAPFLFEMRALLDFVCTTTSLSWAHWVLLEDTAAHLFKVKLEMRGRVENADVLQGKQRQPLRAKLLSAGVMLFVLLLCLVGPLALFSSANPSTTPNRVKVTDVVFGILDAQGTLSTLYSNRDTNSPSFAIHKNTDGASVQRLEFDVFSREIWTTSPPRVNQLVAQLQSADALNWTLEFTFARPGPTDHQQAKAVYGVAMTADHRSDLIPMIKQRVIDDSNGQSSVPAIRIDDLFPPIVQLTATAGVLRRSLTMRSVNVTKHTLDSTQWWSLSPFDPTGSNKENYCDDSSPFCVIAVSDNIVDGLNSLGIGSYGLTAVYIFVVVTIGNAVKGFFRGAYLQVQYNELPDPEDVIELIEGIYIARGETYVGHLKDEVRIFETLIRVLRSPETLSKVTGTSVIHIPSAKEKIE